MHSLPRTCRALVCAALSLALHASGGAADASQATALLRNLPAPQAGEEAPTPVQIATLERQAEAGNGAAQVALARAYVYGLGVAKDEARAVAWLARLVEQSRSGPPATDADRLAAERLNSTIARIQQTNEQALQLKEANRSAEALPLLRRIQPEAARELGWARVTTLGVTQNLATTLDDQGQFIEALRLYETAWRGIEALIAARGEGPASAYTLALATVRANLGDFYGRMNALDASLEHWQAAVDLRRQHLGASRLLALAMLGKAMALNRAGRADEAMQLKLQTKAMLERLSPVPEPQAYAHVLNSICGSLNEIGRASEARPLCEQAVRLEERRAGVRSENLADFLTTLAQSRGETGDAAGELAMRLRALGLAEASGRPDEAWRANARLARAFERRGQPDTAVLFAGRAVELSQQMRSAFGSSTQLAESFLSSKSDVYRQLAELLMAQGRTGEALQVLDLLRRVEADDFVERRQAASSSPASVPADERAALARFIETASRLSPIEIRLARVRDPAYAGAIDDATRREIAAMEGEAASLRATADGQIRRWGNGDRSARTAVAPVATTSVNLPPGAMLLGFVIGADRSYAYWSKDGRTTQVRSLAVTRAKLSTMLTTMFLDVSSPKGDPIAALRALHDALILPIADELTVPHIVVAAVDDVRYVPFAALHDGQDHLVRRFAFQSLAGTGAAPAARPPAFRMTALGISRASGSMAALPGVVAELCSIVRGPVHGLLGAGASCQPWAGPAGGALAGEGFLDELFTETRLRAVAKRGSAANVVHIATHFSLGALDSQSFLTLDGSRLALDRLRDADFGGVSLLTLSACDTARLPGGSQFQGLASFMIERGAQRVIATLWPAADRSTPLLMRSLYQTIAAEPGLASAQALRRAQIAMLDHVQNGAKPFARPYHWAAFVVLEGTSRQAPG